MNLYQIDSAISECVDAESGEVLDFDKLAELSMERDRKIENIALWIKNDLSEAKAIWEEEKSLAARRQSLERAKGAIWSLSSTGKSSPRPSAPSASATPRALR